MNGTLSTIARIGALFALAGAAAAQEADPNHPAYWGRPSVDGGQCCASLSQVRENIDRIDGRIVALMAERQKYVAEAGRFKKDPAAVSAPARVEAVIVRVRKTAEGEASPRRSPTGRFAP